MILVFAFAFVAVVNDIDFAYVEPSLQCWDVSDLVTVYDPFLCLVGFGLLIC